jgi:predicted MFS family arabinose efflux permease
MASASASVENFSAPHLQQSAPLPPPTIGALRYGSLCIAIALAIAAIPFEPLGFRQAVVIVCLISAGISTMFAIVTTLSMSHLLVGATMRGRAAGVWFLCMNAGTVIGSPFVGWISDKYGTSTTLALGAISMLIVFAITTPIAKLAKASNASDLGLTQV